MIRFFTSALLCSSLLSSLVTAANLPQGWDGVVEPPAASALLLKHSNLMQAKRYQDAAANAKLLLQQVDGGGLTPEQGSYLLFVIVQTYIAADKLAEARTHMDRLLGIRNLAAYRWKEIHGLNGQLWMASDNYPKTIESLEQALALGAERDPDTLHVLAYCHYRQQHNDKALTYEEESIKRSKGKPNQERYEFLRALYVATGKLDKAYAHTREMARLFHDAKYDQQAEALKAKMVAPR